MKRSKLRKMLVLLMAVCMMTVYMPTLAFATDEPGATDTSSQTTVEDAAVASDEAEPPDTPNTTDATSDSSTKEDSVSEETAKPQKESPDAPKKDSATPEQGNPASDKKSEAKDDTVYLKYTLGQHTEDPIAAHERSLRTSACEGNSKVTLSAAGLTPGTTVTYTSREVDEASLFKANGVNGFCGDIGNPRGNNREATVSLLSNSSRAAKVMYYYCVKKGWWDKALGEDKGERQNSLNGMYRAIFLERMVQYAYQGNYVLEYMRSWDMNESTIQLIKDKAEEAYDTTVPDNFRAYILNDTGTGVQDKMLMWDYVEDGYLCLQKNAAATTNNYVSIAPANYSLQGAVYYVYTNVACTTRAKDTNGNDITLTTGANGKTGTIAVEPGTYFAKEVTASKGFKLDPAVKTVTVTDANTSSNPATFQSTETPVYKYPALKLVKIDSEGDSGWKRLLGAQYTLSYYAVNPNTADVSGLTPTRTWTFETVEKDGDLAGTKEAGIDLANDTPVSGDAFYMEGGQRVLPLGVFTIKETKAPKAFSKDETVYYGKVEQPSSGADAKVSYNGSDDLTITRIQPDGPQHVWIKLNKIDDETGEALPQGKAREITAGSLAGAEYDVYFDDPREPAGEIKVGTITTNEEGYGELNRDTNGEYLKLGRYRVVESQASPGYTLDKTQHEFTARAQEIESDFVYHVIESREPVHHTYVSKKDITTGEELPGATLQVLNSQDEIIEEWVSTEEPHDIVALHDETQGLKDGEYTLREITAPNGYDTAEDVIFKVESGTITSKVEMKNAPVTIHTTATDVATGSHAGTFSAEEKIKDTVKFENLYAGREYTFKGTLMDKATGEALKDKDGQEITAEKTYTPEGEAGKLVSGSVELEFTVDASAFTRETSVVAFEKVFREDRELAIHADLNDDDQTIHYGGIVGTTALDAKSGTHNILGEKGAVIKDTVAYKNLSTKETYTVTGELFDKTTGQLTGIKSSATFKPDKTDGTVVVEFKFNASKLQGHTFVAYETLLINNIEINRHEDPNDEAQTVYVPKVGTLAGKPKNGKVVDVVAYKNLIPGKKYVVRGYFVKKPFGTKVKGSDGHITFTPDEPNGKVEVTLKTAGKSGKLVAFESLYIIDENGDEQLVGEHKDLKDKNQTVEIKGKPKTGEDYVIYLLGGAFLAAGLSAAYVFRRKRCANR